MRSMIAERNIKHRFIRNIATGETVARVLQWWQSTKS